MICALRVFAKSSTGFFDVGSNDTFFVSKLPGGPGIGYLTTSPVFVSTRKKQSHEWLGRYTRPFASGTEEVYGALYFVPSFHSCILFVLVSNMPSASAP